MKDTTAGTAAGDGIKPWSSGGSHLWARRAMQLTMFLVGFAVLWMFLYNTASPFGFPGFSHYYIDESAKVSFFLSLSLSLSLSLLLSLCLCQVVCFAIGISGGEWRRMKGVNFGGVLDFGCLFFLQTNKKKLNFLILDLDTFLIILCSSCSSLPCDWVDHTFLFCGSI
ncbi:hypothetical protein GLYMA_09G211550v4 [Glycine max]|nr:hypothetical protein GLYMA_09G211550v4 [Glycine max]KAH1043359.1 hypothetical protein GYH30_025278 [Glycine max]